MMPTWIAIGQLLLLAGCASSPPEDLGTWMKPGGTPEEFARDSRECKQEAMYPFYGPFEPRVIKGRPPCELKTDLDLYGACMRARVYRQVD